LQDVEQADPSAHDADLAIGKPMKAGRQPLNQRLELLHIGALLTWGPRHRSEHRQLELLLAGDLAELVYAAGLNLADPFLGDAQFPSQLIEGSFGGSAQAEP